MCLNPLTIRNPTKRIVNTGGQPLYMQVPCGHCAECMQAKRNEWYIRTHYEVTRTLSTGGYVYFDTLTYDDAHLPHLSDFFDIEKYVCRDFSCFNLQHFKAFLKRLRRKLHYHCGVNKNAFRYFLTSEYGTDERYTHRPHYHILFFVYCGVDPLTFSQYVADCWKYGRTDGFPYKPSCYVYEHTYGRMYNGGKNTDFVTLKNVCMYVSKYITKNSTFSKKLNDRIAYLRTKLSVYNRMNKAYINDDTEEQLKNIVRNIDMFHRQSQGFGLSYLDNLTPEQLMFLADDKVVMQDDKKIVATYPCPMYYKRKLYYTLESHHDGSRYWQLTDKGVQHSIEIKLRTIDKATLSYMDIVNNCTEQSYIDKFYKYLDGRDISDLVMYQLLYKGRHRHINGIEYKLQQQKNELTDEEINLYDWLLSIGRSSTPYLVDSCATIAVDESIVRTPILQKEELFRFEDEAYKNGHYPSLINNSHSELVKDYVNRYTFNEKSCDEFRDYDKALILLSLMTECQRDNKQVTFDFIEDIKERFKNLFNN